MTYLQAMQSISSGIVGVMLSALFVHITVVQFKAWGSALYSMEQWLYDSLVTLSAVILILTALLAVVIES